MTFFNTAVGAFPVKAISIDQINVDSIFAEGLEWHSEL